MPKIRNLRSPDIKMSKSDQSDKSRICLDDDPDTIRTRIKQAVTDFTGEVTCFTDMFLCSNVNGLIRSPGPSGNIHTSQHEGVLSS